MPSILALIAEPQRLVLPSCPDCGQQAQQWEFSEVTELHCPHCGCEIVYDYYDSTIYRYISPLSQAGMNELIQGG